MVETKDLSEILSEEQIKELEKLVKENKNLEPTSVEFTTKLKELFKKWEKELTEKGILPEYLAYVVSYYLSKYPYTTRLEVLKIEREKAKIRKIT